MMKKLMWVACFVILFGGSAIATHAQTPVDPTISLHYPDPPGACPTGAYCVNLAYSGPTEFVYDYLFPTVPASGIPGAVIFPPPPTWMCSTNDTYMVGPSTYSDTFDASYSDVSGTSEVTGNFIGCAFSGKLTRGDTFTISAQGGTVVLSLPTGFSCQAGQNCSGNDINLTPELGTGFLFLSGLLLFSLGGFARKRFGVSHT